MFVSLCQLVSDGVFLCLRLCLTEFVCGCVGSVPLLGVAVLSSVCLLCAVENGCECFEDVVEDLDFVVVVGGMQQAVVAEGCGAAHLDFPSAAVCGRWWAVGSGGLLVVVAEFG